MKIACVGSRNFTDADFVARTLVTYFRGIADEYVSGGAAGPDTFGEQWVDRINKQLEFASTRPDYVPAQIPKHIFKPDWEKHGKSAGFIRNKLIIDARDLIVGFWDGKFKSTKSSIDLAIN